MPGLVWMSLFWKERCCDLALGTLSAAVRKQWHNPYNALHYLLVKKAFPLDSFQVAQQHTFLHSEHIYNEPLSRLETSWVRNCRTQAGTGSGHLGQRGDEMGLRWRTPRLFSSRGQRTQEQEDKLRVDNSLNLNHTEFAVPTGHPGGSDQHSSSTKCQNS